MTEEQKELQEWIVEQYGEIPTEEEIEILIKLAMRCINHNQYMLLLTEHKENGIQSEQFVGGSKGIVSRLQKKIKPAINIFKARNLHHKVIYLKDKGKYNPEFIIVGKNEWRVEVIPSYFEARSRVAFKNYSTSTEMDPLTYLGKHETN